MRSMRHSTVCFLRSSDRLTCIVLAACIARVQEFALKSAFQRLGRRRSSCCSSSNFIRRLLLTSQYTLATVTHALQWPSGEIQSRISRSLFGCSTLRTTTTPREFSCRRRASQTPNANVRLYGANMCPISNRGLPVYIV